MAEKLEKDGFHLSRTGRTLPILLLRAREQVMERFRPMLAAHDVTEQQWRVMRVLMETEAMDASELAARASVLAPSLSRILKTLDQRGLITTRKDEKDGRRTLVALTPAGTGFIKSVAPKSAAIYAEIEELLGQDRIETLLDELEALIETLSKGR
ncbi:homoprotocatechuate degradation operon regulator HpaR [Donghicola tyrosinivorans]|uniref:Homoprotocatechuate degradation regulator HpaR n=1 Tax=Donghicola tyrosinivorans TaxID=1652492 RepID=A0A2T0WNQ8_9RHOB|nr:homoprotocatechuate degradation operon regulator HpaR [Donghicola tyrosinivorans]PRY88320.1 homoprotocatechuate degradation regulator HpaR [Donghicola tyrosinivorans]